MLPRMNPLETLQLQLRLEGKEIVDGDLLRQVEAVPGEDMPLMIIAQLADGQVVTCYDESLEPDLRLGLTKSSQAIRFPKIDPLLEFLNTRKILFEVGHYKTNLFPQNFTVENVHPVKSYSRQHPLVETFGFGNLAEYVYSIEQDEKIVSACVSAREDERCGEAWVYTDPRYRHHGFARQVVSVWAQDMIVAGKIPFYSHKIENLASANLARRLSLEPLFEEIVVSSLHS